MLTTELALSFSMVWMIIIANLIGAALMMIVSNRVAYLAFVPGHLIVPGVMLFVLMGDWMDTSTYGDWVTLIIAGIVGYLMKRGGWPTTNHPCLHFRRDNGKFILDHNEHI